MPISSWFPTLLYYEPLLKRGSDKFAKELLADCYQLREYDKEGRRWSKSNYLGGYSSYNSISNIHEVSTSFIELERAITKHVNRFARALDYDLGERQLVMTDCWLNIMPHGTVHGMHLHPLSTISGTFYVQVPKNASAIKFEDPRLSSFMAMPPRVENPQPRNVQYVKLNPQAGNVVLFESWLRHEVGANPSKGDRVSISFNYNWF